MLNAGDIPVETDIDPNDPDNNVDPESTANIPVAVFTTSIAAGDSIDFDASTIDTASLRFGYGQAQVIEDREESDLDFDGDLDSTFMFQMQDTGIACEDTDATLIGQTMASGATHGHRFCNDPCLFRTAVATEAFRAGIDW